MSTIRQFSAALLAVPLVAGAAVAPAGAAEFGHIRSSGNFASIDLTGPETTDAIPGNYVWGGVDVFGGTAMGFLETLECPAGQTPETSPDCVFLGFVDLFGPEMTVITGKGKSATTTVSGELWATSYSFDEETGEETHSDLGTWTLDASLSPYGKASRSTESYTFRDGETGESYSFRATTTVNRATVSGSLGELSLDDRAGYVGSYRMQDRWRTP